MQYLPLIEDYQIGYCFSPGQSYHWNMTDLPLPLKWLKAVYQDYRLRVLNEEAPSDVSAKISNPFLFHALYQGARSLFLNDLPDDDFRFLCDQLQKLKQSLKSQAAA